MNANFSSTMFHEVVVDDDDDDNIPRRRENAEQCYLLASKQQIHTP
jgi:hypothetical protein